MSACSKYRCKRYPFGFGTLKPKSWLPNLSYDSRASPPNEANIPRANCTYCCTSMIVSPVVLDRNVPLIRPPQGGQIGADEDEQERVRKGGSASACAQQAAGGSGRGTIVAC